MRLRFRGPCWDDGEASASALPTAVTLSTPRSGRPSNPLQSLRNFLRSERRLAPRSPIGLLGSRVPPSTDLASWSCAAAIKQGWAMQERDQPGSEEQGRDDEATPAGCALQSGNTIKNSLPVESGDIAAKYPQQHSPTQPLPASPTCCVIVSDPTSALTPELSFPKVMLTDRVHREALFSVTQSMLSTTMGLPWPTASSSKRAQGRKAVIAPADSVGAGICLLELVASHEGKALEPPCPPTVKLAQGRAEKQLQQHFVAITLDLDEDASVLLRKSFPGIGSSTSTRHLDNGDAGDTYGSLPLNKHHSTLNTECPAPPSVWRALDLGRLLEARPIEQRRRRSAVMDRSVLPWESCREQWSTRIEFSPESGKQPHKPSSRGCCDRVASEAEGGTAAVFGMVGQTSSGLPDVVGRGFDVFTRTSMPGPNCDEELRLHDPSPPKRVGLLHLLGNVCRETPLVAADRLRFHQLADEHDRPGFEPASSLSVNAGPRSLFPGCSPSIPMTNVVGGPRSGRGRQPPQELGLGSRQNHGLGLESGGDNDSRQRKKSLLVLARLFAELRKMRHTRPGRVSTQQSLLQELPPHRQLATARQGQYINALFGDNPVSRALSMGNTTKPHESVTAPTDKLLDDILASWRETHAPLPAGNAQGPQQQDPPNHPKVDRARRAVPPSPPAAMPAASCQRSQPGTKTPLPSHVVPNPLREQAHDNPIMNAVRSPQDAPPYEGTPRRSDEPVQGGLISLRPIGEVLGGVEPSSQQLHRGSKVAAQEEGGGGVGDGISTTAKSEAAHAKQVAVRAAVKAAEHGNSAVSKRKLGEVMWGFGATPSRAKGRTSPPPAPMAVGSTSDSAGRTATSGGGCALVSHGCSLGPGESLTVGGGSEGNAGAAGNTAPAEALGSLFVAARHPHQQAATKAGGGIHTQSNHRAQGGGDDPRAVAVATTAASGLPGTSQRPQVSEESCTAIVSDTPEFVKDSHRSGEIRSVGLGSRDKTTRKRVVGNSAGAHLSQPKNPSNGALVSEPNHAHSPRGAVSECDQVSTGSARSPARHAVSSPSVQQGGTTTARPDRDANGSRRLVSSTERDNRSHRPTSVGPAHLVSTGTAISSMSMVRQEGLPSGRGAKQEGEEDAAMAGCESTRQREILALIRAGSVGETFLLSRGRHSTSGAAGNKRQLDSTATGTKTPRRHSEPSGGGAINSFSASTYRDGVSLRPTTSSAVGKQFDRPLYAVVSEDFVSGAGSMVRTLSAPRATPGAISTSRVAQEPIAFRSERPEVATAATATAARAAAAVSRCGGRFHLLELPVERPVNMVIGNRSAVVILDNRRRESRAATSEGVEAARKASRGDRWGGEGDAIVSPGGDNGGGSSDGADGGAAAASAEEAAAAEEEAEAAEAKEKLRLLQLQSLKYSTLWLMVQMEKVRVGAPADGRDGGGGTRLRPALEKLEQWLVGFPCRVLIRYSYSEAQLAELITHAATTEQQQQQPRRKTKGVGATSVAITGAGDSSAQGPGGKRQRLDAGVSPGTEAPSEGSVSRNAAAGAGVRSPLEAVDERSRADSDWAGMHHRQAWFLQLFPALNAFSASALLSCASLKHLIVAPFDELAPGLLGRSGGGDYVPGTDGRSSSGVGAARGGVKAECLLDFCSAVRLEGEQGNG